MCMPGVIKLRVILSVNNGKKMQYPAVTKAVNLVTSQLRFSVSKPPDGFLIHSIFYSLFCFPFGKGQTLNQCEEKQLFPRPPPPSFFAQRYLCSKSGQVALIISSALRTPACTRFLPASPKPRADIVFQAPSLGGRSSPAARRFLLMSGPSSSQSKRASCRHLCPFPWGLAGAVFLHRGHEK